MSRVAQPSGTRGSLKWVQAAVNARPDLLDPNVLRRIGPGMSIDWRSPRADDDFAEYRDAAFLHRLGVTDLDQDLATFWPVRGPQWDALGTTSTGDLLLVEAKAHLAEIMTSPTQATGASRERIDRALAETAAALGATPKARWSECFYQYGNRLAHLHFLRSRGRPAWLILLSFLGDREMNGPRSPEAWTAAYTVMDHVLGLRADHPLARYVVHVHMNVAELATVA